jgi:hypothetical protein
MTFTDQLLYTDTNASNRYRATVHILDHKTVVLGNIFCGEGKDFDTRLSDLLNDDRTFIPITDAEIHVGGQLMNQYPCICVSKQSIAYVIEEPLNN